MSFANLPGIQVYTVDGGLAARRVPTSKSVLVIGTAGQGPAGDPFQVIDRAAAALTFGLSGSLVKAMEEVSANSDNVILYRMGAIPTSLTGVGTDTTVGTATPGFSLTFGDISTTVGTDYHIWYKNGILYVWFNGDIVYANDSVNATVIDTGDLTITGTITGNNGLAIGTGTIAAIGGALTVQAASALTGTTDQPAPTLVPGTDGSTMSSRDIYVALAKALDLLSIFPVDSVYCPDVVIDGPNVAYKGTPATDENTLDWLKTTIAIDGSKRYQWASELMDDTGAVTTAMTAATNVLRITAGFHEVHFDYLLAKFCQLQESVGGGGTCIAFIGTSAPKAFSLAATRIWVGFLPTYDIAVATKPTASGAGLLGIPTIAGCTADKLNILCSDSGTYRAGGLFLTAEGEYDGSVQFDKNGNKVDIGAYVHVFADMGVVSNGYALNYATNLAGIVAGLASSLDEKSNLTNKPVNTVQLWKPAFAQMDALTLMGVNVLRFKGNNILPVMLHGFTMATDLSDYHNLLRQRIKGLVVNTIRSTADSFIGESTIDGLQLTALKTALDTKMISLQKRGYISRYSFVVSVTQAEQRIGHANIDCTFMPADELVQLTVSVGISRQ